MAQRPLLAAQMHVSPFREVDIASVSTTPGQRRKAVANIDIKPGVEILKEVPIKDKNGALLSCDLHYSDAVPKEPNEKETTKLELHSRLNGVFAKTGKVHWFERASAFNHSCLPNAETYWDEKKEECVIRAVRNIKSEEEILINYLGSERVLDPLKTRRYNLKQAYDFMCQCAGCTHEDKDESGLSEVPRYHIRYVICGHRDDKLPPDEAQIFKAIEYAKVLPLPFYIPLLHLKVLEHKLREAAEETRVSMNTVWGRDNPLTIETRERVASILKELQLLHGTKEKPGMPRK